MHRSSNPSSFRGRLGDQVKLPHPFIQLLIVPFAGWRTMDVRDDTFQALLQQGLERLIAIGGGQIFKILLTKFIRTTTLSVLI
jgi:hypothetical protein